jgi:hypothetical protein
VGVWGHLGNGETVMGRDGDGEYRVSGIGVWGCRSIGVSECRGHLGNGETEMGRDGDGEYRSIRLSDDRTSSEALSGPSSVQNSGILLRFRCARSFEGQVEGLRQLRGLPKCPRNYDLV